MYTSLPKNYFDYSFHFKNKIKLFLTQSNAYWDSGYPDSRKNKIAKTFDLDDKKIISPKQIHGDSVVVLTGKKQNLECDDIVYGGDSDIVGIINVADCIPICIYDTYSHNIALVHSGWKGTHKKIVLKTIDTLESMGSSRNLFKIFLGPSIRSCCYEVTKNFLNSWLLILTDCFF